MYLNKCTLCKGDGKETGYIGETSRTIWERNQDHHRDALSSTSISHMRSHMVACHPKEVEEVITSFQMTRIKTCSSALSRQVREAIEIGHSNLRLLNQKEEYNRCLLPSLQVTGPPTIKAQQEADQGGDEVPEEEVIAALNRAKSSYRKR